MDDELLIERIYGAAANVERWPAVFDGLSELTSCDLAGMFAISASRRSVVAWIANERGTEVMPGFMAGGWMERSSQAARMLALGEPRFVGDLDVFTREEIDTDLYYREYLTPNGLTWGAGTFVDGPADNKIIVTLHRPYDKGPLSPAMLRRLTSLRPHLARAAFFSSRLRLERMRGAVAALAALGLPAAALGGTGRVMMANELFQSHIPSAFLDRADRLHLADRDGDRLMADTIAGEGRGRSLALRSETGTTTLVVHLLPLAGDSRDLFSGTDWLLVAVPVEPGRGIGGGVLEALFDLTVAEARIARAMLAGRTMDEIAAEAGISRETVRTQLKSVFRKTGAQRQVDLVRLLGATAIMSGTANPNG